MRTLNLLAIGAIAIFLAPASLAQTARHTVLMDGAFLARERAVHDASVIAAVRAEADRAMHEAPASVMDKHPTPAERRQA